MTEMVSKMSELSLSSVKLGCRPTLNVDDSNEDEEISPFLYASISKYSSFPAKESLQALEATEKVSTF